VFTPHNNDQNQELEQELKSPIHQQDRLKPFTLKEIKNEIKKLNHKKAPGIDLITATTLKELPQKGLLNLMYILNAIRRLEYWPTCKSLKQAQIIMLPKPGKNPTDVTSYRPISLLPTISKVLEKLILKRINKEMNPQDWIPNLQFGFRQAHSTIQQCHHVADTINKALENHQVCTAAFLDVSLAFDKVWHPGLLCEIKKILPTRYFNLLKSYLQGRHFVTKYNNETSRSFQIHSGVPQGSILGQLLYILYTSDLLISRDTTMGTFVYDTAIFMTHVNPTTASRNIQEHLRELAKKMENKSK